MVGNNIMKLISLSLPLPLSPGPKWDGFRSCPDAYRSMWTLPLAEM